MTIAPYSVLMALGIALSAVFWMRLARNNRELLMVYIGALLGAFLGAKLVYVVAEGWMHFRDPDVWRELATGKSILGALLGGYAGVELSKKWIGYRKPTGDWFAQIVPAVVIVGRIGCFIQGCCLGQACDRSWYTLDDQQGVARWPAVPAEILFNAAALATLFVMRRRSLLPNQHFHIYLVGYGLFRFAHEFVRATPHLSAGFSGYQFAALAVAVLGLCGFIVRQRATARTPVLSS